MRFFIDSPHSTTYFYGMDMLFYNSLIDCGHTPTNLNLAELVIVLQLPSVARVEGKKYILLQTEQPKRERCGDFEADKILGFGIENKKEEYFCLGYHPCLEVPCDVRYSVDVGFIGAMTKRRQRFFDSVKNKFIIVYTFDYNEKIKFIKSNKINLNHHSYYTTPPSYTEWDRLSMIIANKSFIISEEFYCPLPVTQYTYESVEEYDELVDYYLLHDKEREDITMNLYELYKTNYDMRDILTNKLKEL